MRLRIASRRTRDSSWLNHRGQRALVLRDADPSGSAPQDEGWESFPCSLRNLPSLRHPGLDPGSLPGRFRLLRMEIPALRCAPAGLTGLGWKMERGPHHRQVRPRRTLPERCSAAEPCPGSSTRKRRAAAHSCLKTAWKRASRGIPALDPGHPSASLQGSGDVPQGGTLGLGSCEKHSGRSSPPPHTIPFTNPASPRHSRSRFSSRISVTLSS